MKMIGTLALVIFIALLFDITWQYRSFVDDVAFLRIKREAVIYPHYLTTFFVHVWTSLWVLLAGLTQFSDRLRRRYAKWHRSIGWGYAGLILVAAAPSGLLIGIHANGGLPSRFAFVVLALFWWGATWKAVRTARRKDWTAHRNWMIRSYALTLSAVTLRAWKWAIVATFAPPPMDTYRLVAWLGWVPNVLLAEGLIWWTSKSAKSIKDSK